MHPRVESGPKKKPRFSFNASSRAPVASGYNPRTVILTKSVYNLQKSVKSAELGSRVKLFSVPVFVPGSIGCGVNISAIPSPISVRPHEMFERKKLAGICPFWKKPRATVMLSVRVSVMRPSTKKAMGNTDSA